MSSGTNQPVSSYPQIRFLVDLLSLTIASHHKLQYVLSYGYTHRNFDLFLLDTTF